MNFTEMKIQSSYHTLGPDCFVDTFLIPALQNTKLYRRAVGFFSSSVFSIILPGIETLEKNGGNIQIVASPQVSKEDIDAITAGYKERDAVLTNTFSDEFQQALVECDNESVKLLAVLVAKKQLDFKIAVTDTYGIYHDKLGIMEDFDGNSIVFYGSPNSSKTAYQENYGKVRLVRSWIVGQEESVADEKEEFDSLWNGTNQFLHVLDFTETARRNLFKEADARGIHIDPSSPQNPQDPIELRDYQKEAINAWIKNDCHGFYVMATGTGKTWTAIYSAKYLTEKQPYLLVICAPYKHLIRQWKEDVSKVYPNVRINMVSGENSKWDVELADAILESKYSEPQKTIIVITTISSFMTARFDRTIKKCNLRKLLIVDEAHRFKIREQYIKERYTEMLGLSATPSSKINDDRGKELMDFFGGQVFNLPIEAAIGKHLVRYRYHPIFVSATMEEEYNFTVQTNIMMSCFNKQHICIDLEKLSKAKRARLRVISMAQEKIDRIQEIIGQVKERDHLIVYCGDGRLFDKSEEGVRHITYIQQQLLQMGLKPTQFTAQEDMKTRMQLVNMFNNGTVDTMVAIRCLDEGINIPSIKSALILSSNDDMREFIQRRGRILRKYDNPFTGETKKVADIYDVIVLPSSEMTGFAKIEFRRYYEYARLADNKEECMDILYSEMDPYNLTIEDISVFEEENDDEIEE